ncbi:hypothetical protein BM526_20120 (plasmid) [Alteromonas mediterranea]|uniref:Calx-beta domain-containing protein n=1 Tax=Alteromonas mediterranea TaxID=314275 RepID=UPI000903F8C4|nr:Calx-beta domain-containing protein [Alteromonas mediterranea]APE04280.1 hypothetical protein BM526_20120 [Alteromonas mediterranea]
MKKSILLSAVTLALSANALAESHYHPKQDEITVPFSVFSQNQSSSYKDYTFSLPENIDLFDYPDAATYIDMNVLAFYTQELLDSLNGDITEVYAFIDKSIEFNNRALEFNGVGIRRNLAGIVKLPSDFDESAVNVEDAESPDTGVSYIATYLSGTADSVLQRSALDERFGSYAASYYAVFTSPSPISRVGQAQLGRNVLYTSASPKNPEVSLYTFAHEIGHTDGMEHDRSEREFSYSYHMSEYGIPSVCDSKGTIMTANVDFSGIPFYSDPNHSVTTSTDLCGVPDVADVARGYREGIETGFIERRSGIMTSYREALPKNGFASLVMDSTVNEANGTINGTVVWDGLDTDQNAFVNVVISNYGDTSPHDFNTQDVLVEYTGESTTSFSIELNNDSDAENDESVTFKLHAANGVSIDSTQSSSTVTITSDEVANTGTVSLTTSAITESEGNTVTLQLERTGGVSGTLTVNLDVTFDSATQSDIEFDSTSVTFLDGETSKSVTIDLLSDTVEEDTETFTVTLSGDNVGSGNQVTVTITDTTEAATPPSPTTPPSNGNAGGESGGGSIHFGLLGLALMAYLRRKK